MIRKFKALGLVLVAAFALSAVIASAAQATNGTLTTFPTTTVNSSGGQIGEGVFTLTDHKIGEGFATIRCKKATLTSTEANKDGDTTLRLHPVYSECPAFGLNSTVNTTGCDYIFHFTTTTGLGGWHFDTTIVCNAGSAIKITTATCEVVIESQSLSHTGEVTNSGDGIPETDMDLHFHTDFTGLTYKVTKDGIGCPLSGTGTFTKADCEWTTTLQAFDLLGNPVGITLHD